MLDTARVSAGARPGARPAVAVVGGGASGVAVAHALARRGIAVRLFERAERLGGRSASADLAGREVTLGGKNIGKRYRRFRTFLADLGEDRFDYFGLNTTRVEGASEQTIDSSRAAASAAALLRGLPLRDAAKLSALVACVAAHERNRYLDSRLFATLGERADDRPLADHFGEALQRRILRTMTVRMNGAEPDEAYLGNFGTNLGMLLDSYEQLSDGLSHAFDKFAERTDAALGVDVAAATPQVGGGWELATADGAERFDHVVLAMPAAQAASVVSAAPRLAGLLREVSYHPAAVIVASYAGDVMTPAVRAVTFDPGEPLSNAGAYGTESLDVVRYTFSGRAARTLLERDPSDEDLVRQAESLLAEKTGRALPERRASVGARWAEAYCAYLPRHASWMRSVDAELERLPGLHLTGDWVRGVSLEACFRAGELCAARVTADRSGGVTQAEQEAMA